VPYKRWQPPFRLKADGRKTGNVCPDEETEQKSAVCRGADSKTLTRWTDSPLIFGVIRSEPSGCTINPIGSFLDIHGLTHCFGRDTIYDEPPVIWTFLISMVW